MIFKSEEGIEIELSSKVLTCFQKKKYPVYVKLIMLLR